MRRKEFIQLTTLSGIGIGLSMANTLNSCSSKTEPIHSLEFKKLTSNLVKDWCDGMIRVQINNPSNIEEHGALGCPACSHIHGRCMDAVYPFLYMADTTGDRKYLYAAVGVMDWAENNVSQENGSWTVVPNPKSWKGITVFGAIALAEALHYHGHVLEDDRRKSWTARLEKAGQYVYDTFSIAFTNINYGGTAIYGLNLIGRVLKNNEFIAKSKALAEDIKSYFTANENLLFGECKPDAKKLSAKGLHGVDLGYNVEETLNSLVMYALQVKDDELIQILTKSLNSHLEFMLPDGAWDNSWGTRQYKWSYWGSRTCDGSQPAFAMMADINPAFGTAAIKNTELLKRCTAEGLIHGGPHYISHGIPPCLHHTFTHAKPLTALLDHWEELPELNTNTLLPRVTADGVKNFKDLDVTLFAKGDWRGTISAYDAIYKDGDYRQATGGALSVLYHNKVGLLCTASMAIYKMVEAYNQQPNPGVDFALTPRVETFKEDAWYSNIFDRAAAIHSEENDSDLQLIAKTELKDKSNETVTDTASDFELLYQSSKDSMQIIAKTDQTIKEPTAFVLPIVSPTGEKVTQSNPNEITIQKPEGLVIITASVPMTIKDTPKERIFNMVPGVEAVPILAYFESDSQELEIRIKVS
ncbi:hypothetical protein GH721_17795 [Kriegella sp. EG-1]|nr:hypothetical protein [Flavobacteriaceae bacterium EG-1]